MKTITIVLRNTLAIVCFCVTAWTGAQAAEFYVSPSGTPQGDGSVANPWDLTTALQDNTLPTNKNSIVQPDDTIWITGGVYTGQYLSLLRGSSDNQIIVRAFPGARVVINGTITHNGGGWTTYWGLEVTALGTPRRVSAQTGSFVTDIPQVVGGFVVYSPGIKIINCVIHDVVGNGIFCGMDAVDAQVYGNIIYHNGWDAPDRGHGHGYYIQNRVGTKITDDNILFSNVGIMGMHAYGEQAFIYNMYFEGNVDFNEQFLVGGCTAAQNIVLKENYIWGGEVLGIPSALSETAFGFSLNVVNKDITITNNIIVTYALNFNSWQNINFLSNKVCVRGLGLYVSLSVGTSQYIFDNNTYVDYPGLGTNFSVNDAATCQPLPDPNYTFTAWQERGFDLHGMLYTAAPTDPDVIIRPNLYDSRLAHIVVYNWPGNDTVAVNASSILSPGDQFEIRDVQDYFGALVASGTYSSGMTIELPLNRQAVSAFNGDFTGSYDSIQANHTPKDFGVFVAIVKNNIYDVSGDGVVTAYDAALALQSGQGNLVAAQVAQRAVGLL